MKFGLIHLGLIFATNVVYLNKKKDICILFREYTVMENEYGPLTKALCKWGHFERGKPILKIMLAS